ncbi:hypothetical protein [Xenorhabdus siamensis]|uniref:hypothetical protein n=1 Tax=Xenorhabdus siamensis TaxID=3136254 RepID=UPI0030F474FF
MTQWITSYGTRGKIDGIDLRLKSIIFQAMLALPALYDIHATIKTEASYDLI